MDDCFHWLVHRSPKTQNCGQPQCDIILKSHITDLQTNTHQTNDIQFNPTKSTWLKLIGYNHHGIFSVSNNVGCKSLIVNERCIYTCFIRLSTVMA